MICLGHYQHIARIPAVIWERKFYGLFVRYANKFLDSLRTLELTEAEWAMSRVACRWSLYTYAVYRLSW